MLTRTFLLFCLSVILSSLALGEAFQTGGQSVFGVKNAQSVQNPLNIPAQRSFQRRSVEVNLKAPKKKEEEKEKIGDNASKMFLAYANPIRNPNSIFVYMLTVLYALGKYSEAHPHGGV